MHLYHEILLQGHHHSVVRSVLSFFLASFPALSLSLILFPHVQSTTYDTFQSCCPAVLLRSAVSACILDLSIPLVFLYKKEPVAFEQMPSGTLSPKKITLMVGML